MATEAPIHRCLSIWSSITSYNWSVAVHESHPFQKQPKHTQTQAANQIKTSKRKQKRNFDVNELCSDSICRNLWETDIVGFRCMGGHRRPRYQPCASSTLEWIREHDITKVMRVERQQGIIVGRLRGHTCSELGPMTPVWHLIIAKQADIVLMIACCWSR